jgi:hypothetical protein
LPENIHGRIECEEAVGYKGEKNKKYRDNAKQS